MQVSSCLICYWGRTEKQIRKNEEPGLRQKHHSVVDVSGGESKVQYYKEQYCVENWNVRSMNQGKLEVVKQKVARVNIDILGISVLNQIFRNQ